MAATLTLSDDNLALIIEKAREFDVEVEPDDPDSGSNAADDKGVGILQDTSRNPAQRELRATLRGEALREARDARDARSIATLIATPMLGDLISEGLATIGYDVPLPPEEEPAQGEARPEGTTR